MWSITRIRMLHRYSHTGGVWSRLKRLGDPIAYIFHTLSNLSRQYEGYLN